VVRSVAKDIADGHQSEEGDAVLEAAVAICTMSSREADTALYERLQDSNRMLVETPGLAETLVEFETTPQDLSDADRLRLLAFQQSFFETWELGWHYHQDGILNEDSWIEWDRWLISEARRQPVSAWKDTRNLEAGAAILDVGCGNGVPISLARVNDGFELYGIDASPTLAAGFRQRLPAVPVECETVEESAFFGRTFDGVVALGVLFLMPAERQREVIGKIAGSLSPGGRFLFSSPR